MEPDPRFVGQEPRFWATVRSVSQQCGYKQRGANRAKVITVDGMLQGIRKLGLSEEPFLAKDGAPTAFAKLLEEYFHYRAEVLNRQVVRLLMNAKQAEALFKKLKKRAPKELQFAMNKQAGKKKRPAYFSAIVMMLIRDEIGDAPCDFDPQKLTTFTDDKVPIRTLARRVDGAFPSAINPVALWEIKEYYYTTTFGSRIADGVYESLLDGAEIDEMRRVEGIECFHYFMVDAVDTWWSSGGIAYLCRIIDMMHMGLVDEALFGREVEDRLPPLARMWMQTVDKRGSIA